MRVLTVFVVAVENNDPSLASNFFVVGDNGSLLVFVDILNPARETEIVVAELLNNLISVFFCRRSC